MRLLIINSSLNIPLPITISSCVTLSRLSISKKLKSEFLSKDRFKKSRPYSAEYEGTDSAEYYMNLHFLKEARRELSGTPADNTSTFSPMERTFMDYFYDYSFDVTIPSKELPAVEAFDTWLVNEVTGTAQNELDREYSEDHKWNKTKEFVYEKGILWI